MIEVQSFSFFFFKSLTEILHELFRNDSQFYISQSIKITGQTNVLVLKIIVVFLLLIENLLQSKV